MGCHPKGNASQHNRDIPTAIEIKLDADFTLKVAAGSVSDLEHFCVFPTPAGHTIFLSGYGESEVERFIAHWRRDGRDLVGIDTDMVN